MTELQRLEAEYIKNEKSLEKCRNKLANLVISEPSTSRRWRLERNYDYYANRKFELLSKIEELKEVKK